MEEKHEYYKKASEGTRKAPIFKSILSLSFLKPFSCVGVLFITAEFSGYQAFMSYMFKVLKHSGFTLDLGLGPIIVGCIRLFVAGNGLEKKVYSYSILCHQMGPCNSNNSSA